MERVLQGMLRMVVVEMLRVVDLQLGMAVVLRYESVTGRDSVNGGGS